MSPVTAIVPYGGSQPRQRPLDDAQRTPAEADRALVGIDPERRYSLAPLPGRPLSAPFLAQLIAAERNLPQARERRRADPGEMIAAYAAAARRR